jgi:hypothetical protein
MLDLKVGQELEVRLPIEFEGKAIPMGARVRVGAIMTELFEPNVALVVVGGTAPESVILPRHIVTLHCTPAP